MPMPPRWFLAAAVRVLRMLPSGSIGRIVEISGQDLRFIWFVGALSVSRYVPCPRACVREGRSRSAPVAAACSGSAGAADGSRSAAAASKVRWGYTSVQMPGWDHIINVHHSPRPCLSQISPQIPLCKKKILHHIKMSAHA
jgi:hypothetical protein